MTTLYLPNEKVPLKIDDITVYVQQLSMAQKMAIIDKLTQTENSQSTVEATRLALKFAVKGIEGVTLSDGSQYKLRFVDAMLDDETVEELMYLSCTAAMQSACFALLKGISNPLTDAMGKVIPGVEIVTIPSKRRGQAKN